MVTANTYITKFCMGARFCSLDQTHLACDRTLVKITYFRRRNWINTKKKSSTENWSVFFPKLGEDQKKGLRLQLKCFSPRNQFFPAIWYYVRPEFVGFLHAGWLFFVWSSSAQILTVGHLNLDGEMSPQKFKYWSLYTSLCFFHPFHPA